MFAISPDLLKTINELQSFECFDGSALGGGTNLANRYQFFFEELKSKRALYSEAEHRTIFDLDKEINPIDEPLSLLKFDKEDLITNKLMPHHSENRIDILEGQKKRWLSTRSSWRKKVSKLCDELDISFPNPFSSDVEE